MSRGANPPKQAGHLAVPQRQILHSLADESKFDVTRRRETLPEESGTATGGQVPLCLGPDVNMLESLLRERVALPGSWLLSSARHLTRRRRHDTAHSPRPHDRDGIARFHPVSLSTDRTRLGATSHMGFTILCSAGRRQFVPDRW